MSKLGEADDRYESRDGLSKQRAAMAKNMLLNLSRSW